MTITVPMLAKLQVFARRRPLLKGMIAYGVLWPTASIIQQTIEGRTFGKYLHVILTFLIN